ncbi:hydroxyisourate hydrolase [Paenibacillus sp. CAU 1782]
MKGLSTHVLDTAAGIPAKDVRIELYRLNEEKGAALASSGLTNGDGRIEGALLAGDELESGQYEIRFYIGEYFRNAPHTRFMPTIWEVIPVRFVVEENGSHYHIPLLASPGGYTTYRGS